MANPVLGQHASPYYKVHPNSPPKNPESNKWLGNYVDPHSLYNAINTSQYQTFSSQTYSQTTLVLTYKVHHFLFTCKFFDKTDTQFYQIWIPQRSLPFWSFLSSSSPSWTSSAQPRRAECFRRILAVKITWRSTLLFMRMPSKAWHFGFNACPLAQAPAVPVTKSWLIIIIITPLKVM